ncbi:protein phosphatase 2C domain-containing protein [Nocardia takedensis]
MLAYDGGRVGALTVRVGSVAAESRRPTHSCNDSAALWAAPEGDICVVAVADGVGPSDSAGRAARAATDVAVRAVRELWQQDPRPSGGVPGLVRAAYDDLNATLADRSSRPPAVADEYRSTIVLAVVPTAVPRGGAVDAVVARIGDSTAWRIRAGALEALFTAQSPSAPFRWQVTDALPGDTRRLELVEVRLADGEVLALTTDGLLVEGRPDAAGGFLRDAWAAPPDPLEFLAALAVRRDDRIDDRAAAVVWCGTHEYPADRY